MLQEKDHHEICQNSQDSLYSQREIWKFNTILARFDKLWTEY